MPDPITPILELDGLCKTFGGVTAADNLSLTVAPGEIHALIGPNGAGKTTTMAQITGEIRPDAGRIRLDGRDVTGLPVYARAALGMGRSFQITTLFPRFSALDNVAMAVQAKAGSSFRFWRPARRDARLREPAREALSRVGLADRADVPASALSHGEKRALELAMALAGQPRLLLLDEPMAGMGPEESQRMVTLLLALKGSVAMLLVEHDMDAVFALADQLTVLVTGTVVASGDPETVRADPDVRRAYLGEGEGEGEGEGARAPC
ncbi:ABC transporter ATP-binding protein [Rhodospirillum sp. A1_3_36]|uniref:ABC transporter ATP-binding protein n=1 Tax=Rhodospirillum sp. A1_3_36 TaxID=3391666 RepID=UPI0039A6028C